MKIGDTIKRVNEDFCAVRQGELYIVREIDAVDVRVKSLDGFDLTGNYTVSGFRVVDPTEVQQKPNYAAAFNMWMDQYVNDPQSFETSYDSAMRHVSEKLGGNEPSYGEVAAEQLKQYLNQLEKQQ